MQPVMRPHYPRYHSCRSPLPWTPCQIQGWHINTRQALKRTCSRSFLIFAYATSYSFIPDVAIVDTTLFCMIRNTTRGTANMITADAAEIPA